MRSHNIYALTVIFVRWKCCIRAATLLVFPAPHSDTWRVWKQTHREHLQHGNWQFYPSGLVPSHCPREPLSNLSSTPLLQNRLPPHLLWLPFVIPSLGQILIWCDFMGLNAFFAGQLHINSKGHSAIYRMYPLYMENSSWLLHTDGAPATEWCPPFKKFSINNYRVNIKLKLLEMFNFSWSL